MADLMINGKKELNGSIRIQGSKNSALPIIAACLLTDETCRIHNCPDILDIKEILHILAGLGVKVQMTGNDLEITADNIFGCPDTGSCRKFRASVILMGPLLAKTGKFVLPYPGGCDLGKRPIDFHIEALRRMGVKIEDRDSVLYGSCNKLLGMEYSFPFPSVGALENSLMAAVLARGTTTLHKCSVEPEIIDLCDFLIKMGADIEGVGTPELKITGVSHLNGCEYTVPGDRIVAGTYMCACAATGGNINIKGILPERLTSVTDLLRDSGVRIDEGNDDITIISEGQNKAIPYIKTEPYPGFPTDMQPLFMALATTLNGKTFIKDDIFEKRYAAAKELQKMHADIKLEEGGVNITGGTCLDGANITAKDLRSGAALVIAALCAKDTSKITGCELIMRGYEDIQRDLHNLGADIIWQAEDEKEK